MERIEKTKLLIEIQKNEDSKNKSELSKEHYEKVLSNINELNKIKNLKDEGIKNKIINIEKRVNLQKKNNELESLKKLEIINAKQEEKDYILNRILKQKKYKYELNLKEYGKKEKIIEDFKNEKKKILLSKRILYEDIQKEKKNCLNKFEN